MRHMRLSVVGGVRDNPDSKKMLMSIYARLVERYGIEYDEIAKYNTGTSYTIMIADGRVKIF